MIARVVLIVGVAELLAHTAITMLGILDKPLRTFLNALLLSLLSAPLLYRFVIRELAQQVANLEEHAKKEEVTAQLVSLMNNVPGVVYRGAPDWSISFIGAEVKNLTGSEPVEFTNGTVAWRSIVHPDDMNGVRDAFAGAVRRRQRSLRVEYRVKHTDGGYRWLEDRRQLIYDGQGEFTSVEGLLLDITDRKRTEEQIRESMESLRATFQASPLPIVRLGLDGRVWMWNHAAETTFGWTESEVIGRPYPIIPEDKRAEFESLLAQGGRGPLNAVERRRQRKDGSPIDISIWTSQLFDSGGNVTGMMGVMADITERKRSEETRARLETAVEQSDETIVITDVEGNIQYVNPAFERVTGYTREEATGRNPRILKSGKHGAEFYREMWGKLARGEAWSGRMINKKKNRDLFEEEATISPVRDAAGRIINYLAVKRDITRLVSLEKQVETAQRMEAVGTLAGGIAHDFNNALTGILGCSELLQMRLAGDPKALGDVEVIRRCADRASTLTRQLLTFARRQIIEPVNMGMNEVVADLLKLLGKVIGEHIEITTSLQSNLPPVFADPGQVEQVLMNLCLNARDAMPRGGQLRIATRVEVVDDEHLKLQPYMVPGRYILLTVSDTGIGMDEKTRDRIFEPFFTTKDPEKGTGLGLAVVYGIVKQHNGFINVYSEPGKGTMFRVYLPAIAAAPEEVKGPVREPVRGGKETILLAEDDDTVRALAERTLAGRGYTVVVARNGEEAVEIYGKRNDIDLVLMDVVMPGMGGKEALDAMRALNPGMLAILMSGYSADSIHQSFVLIPGVAFLPKPFGPTSLARKVREVLDGADAAGLNPSRPPVG